MTGTLLQTTINPIISLFLFSVLFVVWRRQPDLLHVLNWSFTYAVAGLGFVFAGITAHFGGWWLSWIVNLLFGLVSLFTARGMQIRYQGRPNDRQLFAIYGGLIAVASWFSFVHQDVLLRGTSVSIGIIAFLVVSALALIRAPKRDRIDLLLLAGICFAVLLIAARMAGTLVMREQLDSAGRVDSFWFQSLLVVALFGWISLAILFLVRIATDAMRDVAEQSVTDMLSGVRNRRGFFNEAAAILHGNPMHRPTTVALFDIDHFKRINDTCGHGTGDNVIRGLARILKQTVADRGIVGRLGGEEFAVILPGVDVPTTHVIADEVRNAFAKGRHEGVPSSIATTVSVGVAACQHQEKIDEVLERVDSALYEAKRSGRDRVVISKAA
ncbi:GGDEF domain-containing protein [Oricola thermophila]|uniref:diguanylate cyclase n=1 Tax=Oricola thermophila TaxID=2742145 RepID=A0A6N1VEA1_9HYPH|nr:sensor domain-containing diguanylate cyclase [Oricola thermophila]QKV19018.1 diguanylate cyclase [Oricola thermophila]